MSVLDYCTNLRLFSPYEMKIIQILIDQFIDRKKTMFSYLNQINLNKLQFFWYYDTNENNLGGFQMLSYSNNKFAIYINDIQKTNSNQYVVSDNINQYSFDFLKIEKVFSTILHELKHYWQLKKYNILYLFLQLPIIRNYTIQKSAYEISDYVDENINFYQLNSKDQTLLKFKYNVDKSYLTNQQIRIKKLLDLYNIDYMNVFFKRSQFFTLQYIQHYLLNFKS